MKKSILTLIPVLGMVLMLNGFNAQAQLGDWLGMGEENIAILVTDGFNDEETLMPMAYFTNKGYDVTVIGRDTGMVRASGSEFEIRVHEAINDANAGDFDVLFIPGGEGVANLSQDTEIANFVNEFNETGNIIATMSDGQQFLQTAGVHEDPEESGAAERIEQGLEEVGEMFSDDIKINRNVITAMGRTNTAKFTMAVEQAIRAMHDNE